MKRTVEALDGAKRDHLTGKQQRTGRNSIGIEIDPSYCRMAERRLERETRSLFGQATVTLEGPTAHARPASEAMQPLAVSDSPRRRRRGKRE